MKRLLLSLTSLLAVLVMFPAFANAEGLATPCTLSSDSTCTEVDGTITNASHAGVVGATVTVTCDGHTLQDTNNVGDVYAVFFSQADCPPGAVASVSATKGGASGSSSGSVSPTGLPVIVNVAVVSVSLVPELGVITGLGAAIIGGGAFLVIRQQKLGAHQA
jgi:hypothetical protein